MIKRRFNLSANDSASKCPECGNNTQFTAKSEQVSEDGCEVWIVCICGHDPHGFMDKLESVMGGCDEDNIRMAIGCWNDTVKAAETASANGDGRRSINEK